MIQSEKNIVWDSIPDSNTLPEGKYLLQVEDIEDIMTNSGKLMYKAKYAVVEPADFRGMVLFDNYVFGSDDDPNADRPETIASSIGARRMKDMFKKAQVPLSNSLVQACHAARGSVFGAKVVVKKDTNTDSVYYGTERNNITTLYRAGEFTPQIERPLGAGSAPATIQPPPAYNPPPAPPAAPPVAPPAMPAMPAPPQAPPMMPPMAPQAPPTAPATFAPQAPQMPPMAPQMQPAPAQAPPQAPPQTAPVAAPAAAAEPSIPCAFCQQPVPQSQFATHVAACATRATQGAVAGFKQEG